MKICVCRNDYDFENCPYPDAVTTVEIKGFKGEPPTKERRCYYQEYVGSDMILSNYTREEYNRIVSEATLCTYNK